MSPLARLFSRLIRLYQAARAGRPSPCRFFPTCSAYALEAVEVHGALRGGALAARRLCRCHPWGAHGIDLVPEPRAPGPGAPPAAGPEAHPPHHEVV